MLKVVLPQLEVLRLITAGHAVIEKASNGDLFAGSEKSMERSVVALDDLENALASVVHALPNIISPFLRFRREILANDAGGEMLRQLVLHLGLESGGTINLHKLLSCLSANKANIALDMMEQFANHGINDPHFLDLHERVLNFVPEETGQQH